MINKKICAVCLTTSPPMLATAAWKDGELFIAKSEKLPTHRNEIEQRLIPRIIELEGKGFEVLVAETSDFITSRAGHRVRLNDPAASGKPVLVEALDTLRELDRQKAITFPANTGTRFTIPETILDMDRDAKGNTIYRIDWAQLKSEHVLSILCCYATAFNNVSSVGYLKAMFGSGNNTPASEPSAPLCNIVKATERSAWLNGPSSPLTGKGNYL
ncbi:maturation control protein [Pantoea sp. CCBC3-3-1]|uniref:maturation control protein n=1 Tax=Pantoea sp. CCBC3-3-1 TaxID=2490851 RepID=UPI0011BED529|nr:maturation control protein [Pantoea sp. CCBC3-3-1]